MTATGKRATKSVAPSARRNSSEGCVADRGGRRDVRLQNRRVRPGRTFFLWAAFREERAHHTFEIDTIVILPDHLHCLCLLPENDTRYSMRWSAIKGRFTELYTSPGGAETGRSASRSKRGERGVWQRRFWEHVIRDEIDYERHMDYIHYNPVKHELVRCPHEWSHSSFAKWVRQGAYDDDWMCRCLGGEVKPPDFGDVEDRAGE